MSGSNEIKAPSSLDDAQSGPLETLFNDLLSGRKPSIGSISSRIAFKYPDCFRSKPAPVRKIASIARNRPISIPASKNNAWTPATVIAEAWAAKESGATRFCMGPLGGDPAPGDLETALAMIEGVKALMLGASFKLNREQARQLKESGLDYHNHNVDTSERHYEKIIATRI